MSWQKQTERFDDSRSTDVIAQVAWHSLLWLVVANAIGLLLALLLLVPGINSVLGEWTYGRWVMVHMNIELYGWASLPLVGYLFHVYGVGRGQFADWCRPVLWSWSAALGVGAFSWLSGHSTGKLFLDWKGFAQGVFIAALIALWLLLLCQFCGHLVTGEEEPAAGMAGRIAGLIVLLAVPLALLVASSPDSYPAINPATGGPTGASQLESSLAIVLVAILLPPGIAKSQPGNPRMIRIAWTMLIVHAIICTALGHSDASHYQPAQYIGLATILIWLPIVPAYYRAFIWNSGTRLWRTAVLWWWAALLISGPIMFLPRILDHFKFTDGLVGHSFVAMAGFASSLIILLMTQLLGDDAWIFNRARTFYLWHGAVVAYVVVMTVAGWREGFDPAFTIVPGIYRNALYTLRLISGAAMLFASIEWLADCRTLLHGPKPESNPVALERTA
jgi:cytochrome c oxidase cbb3-type subunit I